MPCAYYNEIDENAVAWLRELIKVGVIADGVVDSRPLQEVDPSDLAGFSQCHFFAGIGVWSYALRLTGWPDDRQVWTGSCPCQPFSASGKRKGFADDRHIWPYWIGHIAEHRPPVLFGEQVGSPDGLHWFDLVSADLEASSYAVGAADLSAAGIGAPHIRQRLYWVADSDSERHARQSVLLRPEEGRRDASDLLETAGSGTTGGPAQSASERPDRRRSVETGNGRDAARVESERLRITGFWSDVDWLPCRDGKFRPVEPGTFPLVDGAPARVGRLRGYGNAIVPQVAATFIRAYLEARG